MKVFKTVFLKTAKHDAYGGSCGVIACMACHRRKVATGVAGWIVIAVYVATAAFLILILYFIF